MSKCQSPRASFVSYRGACPAVDETVFLADGARIIGDVTIGARSSVWFNAVVRGDVHSIVIGQRSNIQDTAVIHCTYQKHKTVIGDDVSIAHLAMIHGCTIESKCLIGMQAIVMDGAVIGEGSIVGAGAVVTSNTIIPPGSLVLGAPAKVIRKVTDAELTSILDTTARYLMYADGYDFSK